MQSNFKKYKNNKIYFTCDENNKPYFLFSSILKAIKIKENVYNFAYLYVLYRFETGRILYRGNSPEYLADPYGVTLLLKKYQTQKSKALLKFLINQFPTHFYFINMDEINEDLKLINEILDEMNEKQKEKKWKN